MKKLLMKYKEEELLNYYNGLKVEEQNKLKEDINRVDFKLMNSLYINSYFDEDIDMTKVKPLRCLYNINDNDLDSYYNTGEKLIKKNKYGIVIMAGGNARRLGYNIPKGMVEIKVNNKSISLFNIFINELKEIYEKYNNYICLYIMTNSSNNEEIIKYFEDNNYFDYPKEKIKFFIQKDIPLLDIEGKLLLKEKDRLWFVPNGNGNVFESLYNNDLIKDMKKNKIKYVLFTGVDNPVGKLVDFNFIGATISNGYKLASKTILKEHALDKDWVFCKYNNRPYMIDNNYIKYFTNVVDDDGNYLYRDKNILYHLISIDLVDKFAWNNLKYHRAYKKYDYVNKSGELVEVKSENAFKFEKFIYDAFYYAKDMLLYRVSKNEFCPIKRKEDIKKVEDLLNNKV